MDLLTLALVCGPMVAPATTLRVIEVESAGHAFAIHDNTSGRSFNLSNSRDAERLAATLIVAGHSIDLGLMQINYQVWLKPMRIRLDQAFNPCINVSFGTTILSAAYAHELSHRIAPKEALERALSVYNSGNEARALAYAQKVLAQHLSGNRSTVSRLVRKTSSP
jgi:type IV secretion system protein VirB1